VIMGQAFVWGVGAEQKVNLWCHRWNMQINKVNCKADAICHVLDNIFWGEP
jgi:hypothetical protein